MARRVAVSMEASTFGGVVVYVGLGSTEAAKYDLNGQFLGSGW